MTPDECFEHHASLLKKVDTDHELTKYLNSGLINGDITINTARQHWFQGNALRTTVELHKPRVHVADCCKDTDNPMDCSESYIACEGCNTYPCKTIQTIEKELG